VIPARYAHRDEQLRRHTHGENLRIYDLCGVDSARAAGLNPDQGYLYPQVHEVYQHPPFIAPPHFHEIDQFQVVIGGSGFLGRLPVRPVTIHYVNAFTPYGPIVPGPEGISYMTLRNGVDFAGAHIMPDARTKLRPVRRRHKLIDQVQIAGQNYRDCLAGPEHLSMLPTEFDGLSVDIFRLRTGMSLTGSAPHDGGGQHWLILDGTLSCERQTWSSFSCLFVRPDDPPLTVVADADGAEFAILQYARPRTADACA